MIHNQEIQRMSTGSVIPKAVRQYAHDDIVLIGDPIAGKMFINQFKAFDKIPEAPMMQIRKLISRKLTPEIRSQLTRQFGVQDMDKLFDYAQALITASYEASFDFLTVRVDRFHGVAISMNISKDEQTFSASVYSDDIRTQGRPQPLNMKRIVKVIDQLPGTRNLLTIQGQTPELKSSGMSRIFLKKLKPKFRRYMLDTKYYDLIANLINNQETIQPMSSQTPWMVSFQYGRPNTVDMPTGAAEYLKHLQKEIIGGGLIPTTYTVLGGMNEKGLKDYYRNVAAQKNTNRDVSMQFVDGMNMNRPFFIKEARAFTDRTPGVITIESSYTSRSGLFGYDEHEFINREFFHYQKLADQLVVGEGRNPFGNGMIKAKTAPMSNAMRSLLEKVPEGVHYVKAGRTLHGITDVIDHVDRLERTLHEEVENYKIEIDNIARKGQTRQEQALAIERLQMPLTVAAVYYNGKLKKYDLALVGNGRYPRPRVMDVVKPLFANYLAVRDQVGGGIAYNRVTDGQIEQTAIQRTDAFAALFRSVVGTFYKTYIATGKGPRGFFSQLVVPGDGQRPRDIITINPIWSSSYKRSRYGRHSSYQKTQYGAMPVKKVARKVDRKKAEPRKAVRAEDSKSLR